MILPFLIRLRVTVRFFPIHFVCSFQAFLTFIINKKCPYSEIIQLLLPFVNKSELFKSEPVRFCRIDQSQIDIMEFTALFLYIMPKFSKDFGLNLPPVFRR